MRLAAAARLAVLLVFALPNVARCELINGFNPALNDRFQNGTFPNGTPPAPNPTFLLASFDLSGIGWVPAPPGGTKNVTMISDIHYVAATHFPLGVGTTVAFRAKDGSYVTRQVQSETQIAGSDVLVGQFDVSNPLPGGPNGVSSYPVVTGTLAQFNNQSAYLYGQSGRVGQNILAQFQPPNTTTVVNIGTGPTNVITSDYDPNGQLDGLPILSSEFVVTPGDSGSPTLMIINGQVSLVGHHIAQFNSGPPNNLQLGTADSFLSSYQAQLSTQLGLTGRSLAVQPVPEPMFIIGMAMPATLVWLHRRRRRAAASA